MVWAAREAVEAAWEVAAVARVARAGAVAAREAEGSTSIRRTVQIGNGSTRARGGTSLHIDQTRRCRSHTSRSRGGRSGHPPHDLDRTTQSRAVASQAETVVPAEMAEMAARVVAMVGMEAKADTRAAERCRGRSPNSS